MKLKPIQMQARYEIYESLMNTLTQGMDSTAANLEIPFVLAHLDREAKRWFARAQDAGADSIDDDLLPNTAYWPLSSRQESQPSQETERG